MERKEEFDTTLNNANIKISVITRSKNKLQGTKDSKKLFNHIQGLGTKSR